MKRFSPLVFCLFAASSAGGVQTSKPVVESAASESWLAAQSPRCGEVVGRIMRRASEFAAETLPAPLPSAFVSVVDSGSTDLARRQREGSGAATDAAGEFRVRLPPNRITVLKVRAVGYEPALVALDGARHRAAVLELVLGSNAFDVPHQGISMLTSRVVTTCAP